jgi:hypothetical protein
MKRPKDFNVEVAVAWDTDTKAGACSVLLGVSQEARYAFTAMPDGRAAVALVSTDADGRTEYQTVTASRFVVATRRSQPDTLMVKIRDQKLTFSVNGQRVAEIADTLMAEDWMLGVRVQGHRDVVLDKLITAAR